MPSFNRAILIGNVTRDIELKYTHSGVAFCSVGLAVNDRIKRDGEWVDDTTFLDVQFWSRTAEIVSEYCQKGSPLFVEGRLKLESWEKDGKKQTKLRVVGERIQLLGGGGRREEPPQRDTRNDGPPIQNASQEEIGSAQADDIPF